MHKYHFIYLLIIFILFIFSIVMIIRDKKIQIQANSAIDKINQFDDYYKLMEYREKETILNNGIVLPSNLIMIDENKDSIYIRQLMEKSRFKLVIRYSTFSCDVCLNKEFQEINNYLSMIGTENIVILASNHNVRDVAILKKSISYDIPVWRIEHTNIPFEEESNSLFVFVLDKNLTVTEFFIPEKTLPVLSKNYYEAICSKYFYEQ